MISHPARTMHRVSRVFAASLLALSAGRIEAAAIGEPVAAKKAPVATVVVTAKRQWDPVADAATTVRVQEALQDDPYIYDNHVTIVTVEGIVYLEGLVFDDWDLTRIQRLARRLAGGRRVVNHLELKFGGSD